MGRAPFPIDLFPKLLTYIKIKDWFYIIFFNKEVFIDADRRFIKLGPCIN